LINPYFFPKSSRSSSLPTSSAFGHQKSYWFLKFNEITCYFRSSVLLLGLSITVCSSVLSSAFFSTAIAQTQSEQQRTVQGEQTISQVNVLFVNPSVGDDKAGNGSERSPFKTISQALKAAAPNSTIMLAQGTYSEQTGEIFPLILKPGVTIQGDARTKGRGIVIQGGDDYLTRSFGRQNAAIVGANQASVIGITIMNPKPRGYGILIESTNPTISENTFAGNTQDGISITGNATPIISKNYFYQNKANGLTVSGNARPEIRENIFQQTGFGINIAQNAEPLVIGNQIQFNRAGVVVQASSRPKLRNNIIQSNREDGLVVMAQAVPDLGSASEPGGNQFRNNMRYDINASASKQLFSAAGNSIASNRIAGNIDLSGNTTPVTTVQSVSTPAPTNEITFTAPAVSQNVEQHSNRISRQPQKAPINSSNQGLIGNISSTVNGALNRQLTPLRGVTLPLNAKVPQSRTLTARNQRSAFPVPNNLTAPQRSNDPTAQINYVRINPQTVEFTAPTAAQPISPTDSASQLNSPNNIIQMTTSAMVPMPNSSSQIQPTNTLGTQIADASNSTRYRVIVSTSNERDEDVIRFLAPGAFRTTVRGQGVIQVGVFSNTFNAEQMIRVLNNNGLKGVIEPLQ
jgi:parallel beta-helix repeat protein